MRRRRFISLLICIVTMVGILEGCQKSNTEQAASEADTENQSVAEERVSTEQVTLNLYSSGITYDGTEDEAVLEAVSEKFFEDTGLNIKINVTSSSYDEEISKVNRLIAAGELDAWMSAQPSYAYVEKGLTEDITDLMENYGQNIKARINEEIYDYYSVEGRLMGLALQSPVPTAITPLIRKDLLDKVGLDVPKTMDELENAILTIKETDASLVGITSQIAQWVPLAMFAYGGVENYFDEDGYPVPMIETDYTRIFYEDEYLYEYLGLLNRWYENGVLNPETFTITSDKFMDLYNRDKIICTTWGAENVTQTQEDYEKNGPKEAEWVMMDELTCPNGLPSTWGYSTSVANVIYVTKGSKNAETFIRLLDWCCEKEENALLALLGIEGTTYEMNERGKVSYIQDSTGQDLYSSKFGNMFYNLWSEEVGSLTRDYINDEWKKIYSMDIYSFPDCNISYTYTETEAILTTLKTIAEEYFVKMVVGDISVEEGIPEMKQAFYDAGVEEYEAERMEIFKEVYPDGWY